MYPIQKATKEIKLRKGGASFLYLRVAKKYGINCHTLAQRHQGQTQPRRLTQLSLHPQHKTELIQYIKLLTKRRTPPSRTMIRNFALSLAGREVSESWVTRFMNRNSANLILRWQTAMDRNCHKADSEAKYSLALLHLQYGQKGLHDWCTWEIKEGL
ncbi:hypothetical protein EJ02DRAFT_447676 [Clathrospora elynae]|uniref:HTH CENPB-type domain-containing protein n=1 Tax=Clathrospora elynae TaxID=706981 RepID=A0A6A5SI83_9PLEO|nr:hypothetical protein EJ02DRAFT_447676 [Clathrospora elynae]